MYGGGHGHASQISSRLGHAKDTGSAEWRIGQEP